VNDPVLSHVSRASIFQREATWRLGADALEREGGEPAAAPWWAHAARYFLRLVWPWRGIRIDPGGPGRFPHADIRELRLSFDPTRFDTRRHRCDIRTADGRRAALWSTHFVSVAEFEDRAASYTQLVRALIAHVAAANPQCAFRAGKRPLIYWAEQVFLVVMAAAAVWVLALVGGSGLNEITWVKLALVAGFIPLALRYARKNRPRRFEPGAIPPDVLPDANPRDNS
jgi:hypothetical protein